MTVVLDAAALMALLLDEDGGGVVARVVSDSVMSTVNVSECCARAVERGASANEVIEILSAHEIALADFDRQSAIETAQLRATTRHVGASLGDRACLALARRLGLPIYTGDRRMASLDRDLGIDIRLIR